MSSPTYSNIESLIASQEVQGSSVSVTFRCDQSGVEVSATSTVQCSDSMQATAARSAKRNAWYSARSTIMNVIYDVFGSGAAGRVARDVASNAVSQGQDKTSYSKQEIQDAVVKAFVSVQDQFTWNADSSTWSGVSEADSSSQQAA